MLFKFFDQWRSITSNRFVLNMVWGHHLQLRSCPPLFHDFRHFDVKVAAAHHPVIQKKVDKLLAKGAIEPSSSGAGFYSSMLVVSKHTEGLCAILNLKHFNHLCTFFLLRCQLLNLYGSLSSRVIIPFPLIYRMLIYMFPLLSIIIVSYILLCIMCLISGRFYLLGLPQPLGFYIPHEPILFLCHCKGLHIVIYLDDILVLIHSKWVGKRACLFLCSLLVHLGLHINFSKSDLCLSQSFTFLGLCWDTVPMLVSLPPDKLADSQQLALSLLQTPHVTVCKVMSFLGKANFCTNGHSQFCHLCCLIQSDMLSVYDYPTQLFSHVHFSLSSLCQLEWLAKL